MKTPIYDFLDKYSHSDNLRCHMPGHKGRSFFPELEKICSLDITEIAGADSLFEADGIILQSEKNMSALYGSKASFYSAGGSTLCIQAMLAAVKFENRTVIAVRNVHRAFLNAAALLDISVKWILPDYSGGILSGTTDIEKVEDMLRNTENACLYITSPDYTGKIADIKSLAELCHKYGAVLLVDNAHGSHLRFMPENQHPISLGADICCDSAHKMLPAITGAAVLHTSSEKYAAVLRQCMSMFASTSPSYLIMASLDLCCQYIEKNIRNDIIDNLRWIYDLKIRFSNRLKFTGGDPFHITIKAAESSINGNSLAQKMRESGVECEYSDNELVILLMSPMCRQQDYCRLESVLEKSIPAADRYIPEKTVPFLLELPEKAMSIREAVFSPCEEIAAENSEGRICAGVKVPCPPAVPVAASGEIINKNCINIFKRYGISTVIVVK